MNPAEALALTRLVAAMCPAQKFDEYTPDAWGVLLEDVRFEDARHAVTNLGRKQVFIAPSEILTEVRRIRDDRLARNPEPAPPDEMADDPHAQQAWQLEMRRRIADGALTTTVAEVNAAGQERLRALVAGVGREVPTA